MSDEKREMPKINIIVGEKSVEKINSMNQKDNEVKTAFESTRAKLSVVLDQYQTLQSRYIAQSKRQFKPEFATPSPVTQPQQPAGQSKKAKKKQTSSTESEVTTTDSTDSASTPTPTTDLEQLSVQLELMKDDVIENYRNTLRAYNDWFLSHEYLLLYTLNEQSAHIQEIMAKAKPESDKQKKQDESVE